METRDNNGLLVSFCSALYLWAAIENFGRHDRPVHADTATILAGGVSKSLSHIRISSSQ